MSQDTKTVVVPLAGELILEVPRDTPETEDEIMGAVYTAMNQLPEDWMINHSVEFVWDVYPRLTQGNVVYVETAWTVGVIDE